MECAVNPSASRQRQRRRATPSVARLRPSFFAWRRDKPVASGVHHGCMSGGPSPAVTGLASPPRRPLLRYGSVPQSGPPRLAPVSRAVSVLGGRSPAPPLRRRRVAPLRAPSSPLRYAGPPAAAASGPPSAAFAGRQRCPGLSSKPHPPGAVPVFRGGSRCCPSSASRPAIRCRGPSGPLRWLEAMRPAQRAPPRAHRTKCNDPSAGWISGSSYAWTM